MNEHLRIWRYRVHPARQKEFAQVYSSEGAWTQLFRRGDGYLGTSLWQDANDPDTWYTLDRWSSQAKFEAFMDEYASVYAEMDKQFEQLAGEETLICDINRSD